MSNITVPIKKILHNNKKRYSLSKYQNINKWHMKWRKIKESTKLSVYKNLTEIQLKWE